MHLASRLAYPTWLTACWSLNILLAVLQDMDFLRHKPLRLSEKRYSKLQALYHSHGLVGEIMKRAQNYRRINWSVY